MASNGLKKKNFYLLHWQQCFIICWKNTLEALTLINCIAEVFICLFAELKKKSMEGEAKGSSINKDLYLN